MGFRVVERGGELHAGDLIGAEKKLLALAARDRLPLARLWLAAPALVVPRSYRHLEGFDAACAELGAAGCPVHVRPSGGGVVPQGPGMLNLSLAYTVRQAPGNCIEAAYLHLCGLLAEALASFGVRARWQAVEGSFCDGRFNLACGSESAPRKIAGTAQYWQRLPQQGASSAASAAPPTHAVLAHAVLLVDPDLAALHERANALEAALGRPQRYLIDRTTSLAAQLPAGRSAQHQPLMPAVIDRIAQLAEQAWPPDCAG